MTGEQAIERVAALLAFNTAHHVEEARKNPNLRENTKEAKEKNLAAAEVLGFANKYRANCSTLNVDP